MKKIIILLGFIIGGLFISKPLNAQSNWEAGLRFGDITSLDITIPFKAPRIHAAAYFQSAGAFGTTIGLGGYFDWMFALNEGPAGLKFYPGVGPEFYFGDSFNVAVAGDFGAEYSFEFPLTVGLDWRPRIGLTNNTGFYAGNWGLIARFRFGEGVSFKRVK